MCPEDLPTNPPEQIDWETVGQDPRARGETHDAVMTPTQMWQSLAARLRIRGSLLLQMRVALLTMSRLSAGQYSVGLLTVWAWIGGFALSKDEAPKEFYSASAGAITTLLLALALTAAWFRLDRFPGPRGWVRDRARGRSLRHHFDEWNELENMALANAVYGVIEEYYGEWTLVATRWVFRVIYGVSLLASLLVGEMFALLALMESHPETAGEPRLVLAAVTAGLVGIGLVALLGGRDERDS